MAWEDGTQPGAQPGTPASTPTVYEALFIDTATAPTDVLRVKVPGFDDGEHAFDIGTTWVPRPGPVYPSAGDLAVVIEALALDGEAASWWVVSWTPY